MNIPGTSLSQEKAFLELYLCVWGCESNSFPIMINNNIIIIIIIK